MGLDSVLLAGRPRKWALGSWFQTFKFCYLLLAVLFSGFNRLVTY